jgi:hypothetical protein
MIFGQRDLAFAYTRRFGKRIGSKEFFFSGAASDNCRSPSANFLRLSVPPSGLSVWRMESEAPTITQLLVEWSRGNQQALDG